MLLGHKVPLSVVVNKGGGYNVAHFVLGPILIEFDLKAGSA